MLRFRQMLMVLTLYPVLLFSVACQKPAVETVPILEDVQPGGLAEGEIWMALPVDRAVVFRGDVATLPVKVAGGPKTNEEVTIRMRVQLRTGQEPLRLGTDPEPPAHWVNGYTPNARPAPGEAFSTPARVTYQVPFTKHLRLRVHDDSPVGSYLLEFELEGKESGQRVTRHMQLAIHEGSTLQDIPVIRAGDRVEVEIRDDQGHPKSPSVAYLHGSREEDEAVLLLYPVEPGAALHTAKLGSIDPAAFEWELVIYKRGYRHYRSPVEF